MLTRGILMQVNMNPNMNTQSFGAIRLCGGAEDVVRKVLKPADWVKFDEIAKAQEDNSVNINLFANDGNKLMGRIIPNNSNFKQKDYYQLPFFESAIKFIDKMAKKADNIAEKIKELPAVNVEEIIGRLKS